MKYYIELTLIENKKYTLYELWSKVYTQIHIAFADYKNSTGSFAHGVSFPEYRFNDKAKIGFIGGKLRIFASSESQLKDLNLSEWLSLLTDYVHITSIKDVPNQIDGHLVYQRKRVKGASRIEKEMREKAQIWAEKSGKPLKECLTELEKTKPAATCHLPFIFLNSEETKKRSPDASNRYQLFIEMQRVGEAKKGLFDSYGLSSKESMSSVPDFK